MAIRVLYKAFDTGMDVRVRMPYVKDDRPESQDNDIALSDSQF
jgi:hypothetical protein